MSWLDIKYANLVSMRLDKFKVKQSNPYLANFRCKICGDSKKNPNKCRGYIYNQKGTLWYSCHNCGAGMHLSEFIKLVDPQLYGQYVSERYLNNDKSEKQEKKKEVLIEGTPLETLYKISELVPTHPTREYVASRMIPPAYYEKLYAVDEFKHWVEKFMPGKFENMKTDEPRLVIPFYNKKNSLIGFQGRSLKPLSLNRYITIMMGNSPKVFGWDEVDDSDLFYVLEGPIDSMFVDNSIAMIGSSVPLKELNLRDNNAIFVYDNQPRNPEIVNKISRKIKEGYMVALLPDSFKHKDINDAILAGYTTTDISNMLASNRFKGLEAELKFSHWRKV